MTDQPTNVVRIDTCPDCSGVGWVTSIDHFQVVSETDRIIEYPPMECPTCEGKGRVGASDD